jgi:aminoglycoside N3'-acetyltransferase
MTHNYKEQIKQRFNKLKINKNDKILVYSNLLALGYPDSKVPKVIVNILKEKIGKEGEIVMPSYFLKSNRNIIKTNIDKKTNGILAYYFFNTKKKICQSNSLFHSHIGYGKSFCSHSKKSKYFSFGKGSDFDFFLKNKFKIISIGLGPSKFLTYLHHVEELLKVNYRKWININRNLVKKKIIKKIKIKYYARKENTFILNIDKLFFYLIKKGLRVSKINLKYGKIYFFKVVDVNNFLKKNLKKYLNKYIYKNEIV